jgi:hypothetical protein
MKGINFETLFTKSVVTLNSLKKINCLFNIYPYKILIRIPEVYSILHNQEIIVDLQVYSI